MHRIWGASSQYLLNTIHFSDKSGFQLNQVCRFHFMDKIDFGTNTCVKVHPALVPRVACGYTGPQNGAYVEIQYKDTTPKPLPKWP